MLSGLFRVRERVLVNLERAESKRKEELKERKENQGYGVEWRLLTAQTLNGAMNREEDTTA